MLLIFHGRINLSIYNNVRNDVQSFLSSFIKEIRCGIESYSFQIKIIPMNNAILEIDARTSLFVECMSGLA